MLIRAASGVDMELPYRVRIVNMGFVDAVSDSQTEGDCNN